MLRFTMGMPLYLMAISGSILILVVYLLRSLLKNRLPKLVFPLLWGLVLIRLLLPFSLSSPLSSSIGLSLTDWQLQHSAVESRVISASNDVATVIQDNAPIVDKPLANIVKSSAVEYSIASPITSYFFNWRFMLGSVFLIGLMFTTSVLIYQKWSYSKRLKNSLLIEHNETINTILREMGMGHILLFTNDEIASPLVCGLLNPRIYLPTRMDFQNMQLLRHILIHETMHIKHKDNWLKTFMIFALCLHWYNPLVWLMSKWLSSDLESACDAALLKQAEASERQSYAYSLLSMAITGARSSLLYSAFSKTEVERRIKNILHYKKATTLTLIISIVLISCSVVTFATYVQAPFSDYLSSYCKASSKWAARAILTRDIKLGESPDDRANDIIFDALNADITNDPTIITSKIQIALAKEFGVEKGAFQVSVSLCLDEEILAKEYKKHGLIKGKDGLYLYNDKKVRSYTDEMLGSVQTEQDGIVDISVLRNHFGEITSIKTLYKGDAEFDHLSKEITRNSRHITAGSYERVITKEDAIIID